MLVECFVWEPAIFKIPARRKIALIYFNYCAHSFIYHKCTLRVSTCWALIADCDAFDESQAPHCFQGYCCASVLPLWLCAVVTLYCRCDSVLLMLTLTPKLPMYLLPKLARISKLPPMYIYTSDIPWTSKMPQSLKALRALKLPRPWCCRCASVPAMWLRTLKLPVCRCTSDAASSSRTADVPL